VFPTQWPAPTSETGCTAQIDISVEPLADLDQKEGVRLGAKEEFAKRVAMNLYHFLESFHGVAPGPDSLVVPANFLDRWFAKFLANFRRDPDFLTREHEKN
jgi:ribulose-phosphate 3-epimerase